MLYDILNIVASAVMANDTELPECLVKASALPKRTILIGMQA